MMLDVKAYERTSDPIEFLQVYETVRGDDYKDPGVAPLNPLCILNWSDDQYLVHIVNKYGNIHNSQNIINKY